MSNVHGYSLWLVPDTNSEAYRALARCIADISKKYQTPDFVPHATLLGSVGNTEKDMRAKTQELAGELAPYEIRLDEIGSNRTYFQILFSKIEQTEAVMRANTIAQKVFVIDQGTYLPHLSLAYGDLSPEQIALLKQLLERDLIPGTKFIVREIELWHTEGEVGDWCNVSTFPFNDS